MVAKFTKGPWVINSGFQVGVRVDFMDGFFTLADCQVFKEGRSNAHLIAAAPEMYELLERISISMECYHGVDTNEIDALLAKARGE